MMYEEVKMQLQKGFSILSRWIIFCKAKQVTENPGEVENGEIIDRISQLPESIVHHILSLSCFDTWYAHPRQLVRMSVLSKTWFHLTASFPILDFKIHNFGSPESFFKYVEYATTRFSHQNLTAHRLKIITTIQEPAELEIVKRCLESVLKKGVRELEIDIDDAPMPKYCLPNILFSVSMLQSLITRGCELPSSLMVDAVKFKSLIRLILENVHIDDDLIKYLTASCPLLQDFHVIMCHGFKIFCVHRHQNLQNVWIHYGTQVERIDIEAPNLSTLSIADMYERGTVLMNLASCKKLTTMTYIRNTSPNSNCFTDFLSNFPFIENLVLVIIFKCNNLKFSSGSLRRLVLKADSDLEGIEFSTPKLALFVYASLAMNRRWPLRDSTHLKSCMQCYPDNIDTLWFQKLRRFLDKKNGFKVLNLYIHAPYSENFIELEKLKAIDLPPYELEHVELRLDISEESFVDAVLWCCRPRSLTLKPLYSYTDFGKRRDLVKRIYERLLEQEDEGHTEIQIVWPSSSATQKHWRDLKSLSMALCHEKNAVSFIKEKSRPRRIKIMEHL